MMMITVRKAIDVVDPSGTEGTGAAIVALAIVAFAHLRRIPDDSETAAALRRFEFMHGRATKAKVLQHFAELLDCEIPLELLIELMKTDEQR